MPKKFPLLEVSGDDNTLKANIKRIPDIKYNIAAKLGDIIYFFLFSFFLLYICNILWVTKNPPKILIAASAIAAKPRIFENSKLVSNDKADAATIAPTIITDEIAFVTDIKGV